MSNIKLTSMLVSGRMDIKDDIDKLAKLAAKSIYVQGWNKAIEAAAQLSLADRQNVDVIRALKK